MKHVAAILALALLTFPATGEAQSSRYNAWSNPDGSAQPGDLDAFIERLNTLIDEAEQARAADPRFLQDLRALASSAKTPWNTVVLDDSFGDGNFDQNPRWTVRSGEYFIETGWGLRNRLSDAGSSASGGTQSSGDPGADLAAVVLGQILKRAANTPDSTASGPVTNVITTAAPLSNTFSVRTEISSWVPDGRLEIGVYQGEAAELGYRVVYQSGQNLQLVRVGSRGAAVIDTSANPLTLEDKEFHTVEWTRGTDGLMRVMVDGQQVLSVTDHAFSDPFDGVRLSNPSGDFIVRRITATGT